MSSASLIEAVEHVVSVRKTPKVNGEATGWDFAPNLRCQDMVIRKGANSGDASFTFVPLDRKPAAIEDVLGQYHPDHQVRVQVFPYDGVLGADAQGDGGALVVFEGVLERQPCRVVSNDGRVDERCDLVALALPWIDNRSVLHTVTGRWIYDPNNSDWDRVESPSMPAAFNYRGRGNMDGNGAHQGTGGGLTARPFTHDDDLAGLQWTVGEALKSILAQWLFGVELTPRVRVTGVEAATISALNGGSNTGRWEGLNDILPETDVSALGVFDAVAAVCAAGGFEFSVGPDINGLGGGDRFYQLRIWRRHAGDPVDLFLPKRGQFPASAAGTLARANVTNLHVMRDTAGITNQVLARGRVLIEAGIELKPLWDPADLADSSGATLPESHALPVGVVTPEDAYHNKHVQGGADFREFAHVGRLWGIDCTGDSASLFYPTGVAPYGHDTNGFDWLTALGITGSDPLSAERAANNVSDPIIWTRRIRRVMPLRRAESLDTGERYAIAVSENGGSSFSDVTDSISFTTLRDFLGIRINNLGNLAAVSLATIGTGELPAVADSWYKKILEKELVFRLTCLIEADHASTFLAGWQPTSGTGYSRFQILNVDADEVWSHQDSALNTSGEWQKLAAPLGTLGFGGDLTPAIRGAAQRRRDANEGTRWSVGADTFLLQPDRYRVGDSVRGVIGRNIEFATNAGSAVRYPSIAEIRLVLCDESGRGVGQGMFLSLNDTAQRGGI